MTLLAGLFLACTAGVVFTAYLGLLPWNLALAFIAVIVLLFYLMTTLYWARDISLRVDAVDEKLRHLEVMRDNTERLDALEDRLNRLEGTGARGELVGAAAGESKRLEAAQDEDEGERLAGEKISDYPPEGGPVRE